MLKWEEIQSERFSVWRAKVAGGWLVFVDAYSDKGGLTFYPDPTYAWKV